MTVLFAHDHSFLYDGAYYYSKSGLPQNILQRYADVFGNIEVVCRRTLVSVCELEPITDSRIKFFPQPNIRNIKKIPGLPCVYRNLMVLVEKADIIIARLPSSLGLIVAHLAVKLNKKLLIEVVGNSYESNVLHGSYIGKAIAPFEHYLTARLIWKSKHVMYITQKYLQKIYPASGAVYICPNVSIDLIPETCLATRKSKFYKSNRVVIGIIGSLDVSYKGHDTALRVIRELINVGEWRNIRLELVGAGDKKLWVQLAASLGILEYLDFKGSLKAGASVNAWIDGIDILLQPSRTEGQGRSIIEAMSRGCPVVASNVGGIAELLNSSVMANPHDVSHFSNIVEKLLSSEDFYIEQSRRNWHESVKYSREVVSSRRNEMFKQLLGCK